MSQENETKENRGGQRPGAGRKPKAIRWAHEIADAEGLIIAALPDVIGGLIKAALAGDTSAARYLLDRVWGRVPEQAAPLAEDISLPTDHQLAEVFARHKSAHQYAQEIQDTDKKAYQETREGLEAATSREAWEEYNTKIRAQQQERDHLAKQRAALELDREEIERGKEQIKKILVALQEDPEEEEDLDNPQEIKVAAE